MLAFVALAHATVMERALDPAALAVLSDAAVLGSVVSTESVLERGMIWTVATLAVEDLDTLAEVWIPGGCVGGLCLTVSGSPWLDEGAQVFVFLHDGQPTALSQGVFRIEGEEAVRDLSGVSFRTGGPARERFPVAELQREAAALRRGG